MGARPAIVTCLAGGGGFGYGFHMGVIDGARDAGLDLGRWPLIGTSAGAHAAATVGTHLTFDAVADGWAAHVEQLTGSFGARGAEMVEPIYGGLTADDVAGVAVRLLTFRRHVLRSEEVSLVDIVAASTALFPLLRPHKIDGKRYIDGGAVSLASADLAPPADLLVVLTPFAGTHQGVVGRVGQWQANREMRKWCRHHDGRVIQVAPSPEMAALGGRRLREVGDIELGRRVYPLARQLGRVLADTVTR